jgi:hypothetical protein
LPTPVKKRRNCVRTEDCVALFLETRLLGSYRDDFGLVDPVLDARDELQFLPIDVQVQQTACGIELLLGPLAHVDVLPEAAHFRQPMDRLALCVRGYVYDIAI